MCGPVTARGASALLRPRASPGQTVPPAARKALGDLVSVASGSQQDGVVTAQAARPPRAALRPHAPRRGGDLCPQQQGTLGGPFAKGLPPSGTEGKASPRWAPAPLSSLTRLRWPRVPPRGWRSPLTGLMRRFLRPRLPGRQLPADGRRPVPIPGTLPLVRLGS